MDCLASLPLSQTAPPPTVGAPLAGPLRAFAVLLAQAGSGAMTEDGAGLPGPADGMAPDAAGADPMGMAAATPATIAPMPIGVAAPRAGPALFGEATADGSTAMAAAVRPATAIADGVPDRREATPAAMAPADPAMVVTDAGGQPEAAHDRPGDAGSDPAITSLLEGRTVGVPTPPGPTVPPQGTASSATPLPQSPQPAAPPVAAPAASPATIHAAAPPHRPGAADPAPPRPDPDAAAEPAAPVPAGPAAAAPPPPATTTAAGPSPPARSADGPPPAPEAPASPPISSAAPALSPATAPEARVPAPAAPPATPARQVAPVLISVAIAGGTARLSLTLEPAELGRVEISIERQGDTAEVRVQAERPETLALLRRDQRELDRTLTQAGIGADGRSLSFSLAEGGAGGRDAEGRGRMARGVPEPGRPGGAGDGHTAVAAPPRRPLSLLDLAV